MTAWPADLGYGTLTGQVGYMTADGPDVDQLPDMDAGDGTVTVTPSVKHVTYTGTDGPRILAARSYSGILNSEGFICTKDAEGLAGPRGIVMAASDSLLLSPTGFTYNVDIKLGGVSLVRFDIEVPAGATVDAAIAAPVASSGGTAVIVDTTTADRAEDAAVRAEDAADRAEAAETGGVDLTGYATEEWVGEQIAAVPGADLTGYATETWVGGQITAAAPDLAPYALTADVPDVTGLASEGYVDTAISGIPAPDLSGYAKTADVPDVTGLASETYVDDAVAAVPAPDLTDYATKAELPDLAPYAKTADIPSTVGLASEQYVDDAVAAIPAQDGAGTIRGAGRPDQTSTLDPAVLTAVQAATPGAIFLSSDGASVGAWSWQLQGTAWTVIGGNTGWRDVKDMSSATYWDMGNQNHTVRLRITSTSIDVQLSLSAVGTERIRPIPLGIGAIRGEQDPIATLGGSDFKRLIGHDVGLATVDQPASTLYRTMRSIPRTDLTYWPTTLPGSSTIPIA